MSTTDHTSDPMGDALRRTDFYDRGAAERRALAAEVASRGYRERAEKAEAKSARRRTDAEARTAGTSSSGGKRSRPMTDPLSAGELQAINHPHPAALHSVAVVTNYTATGLDGLADMIHENAVAHGFWDTARPLPESIALMHSELSEALEADRAGEPAHHVKDGKPEGVAVELVDCLIRILDTLATLDVNIDVVVADKMAYNATRPRLHGKEY